MVVLGKLEQVPLREVWKHEASDFTQWLAMPDNIDLLAEVILGGGSLTVTDTEVNVGTYKADILAVDSEDRVVVIENQLEQTDHDHLGKILTYGAGKQAEARGLGRDRRQDQSQRQGTEGAGHRVRVEADGPARHRPHRGRPDPRRRRRRSPVR